MRWLLIHPDDDAMATASAPTAEGARLALRTIAHEQGCPGCRIIGPFDGEGDDATIPEPWRAARARMRQAAA